MLFRKIVKFKYNGKKYQMFLSPQNAVYYMRIDENDEYQYLTLKEYIEVSNQFRKYPYMKNAQKDDNHVNITPKVIFKKGLAIISPAILSLMLTGCLFNPFGNDLPFYNNYNDNNDNSYYYEIQNKLDFQVEETNDELQVEYYFDNPIYNTAYVYDNNYLDKVFEKRNITKNDLISVINNNSNISESYKSLFLEYVDMLYKKYPNNNYQILYENLKNLVVHECKDDFELFDHTWSFDSYACYVAKENTIYTRQGYKYEKGTWEYQVIMHELSHVLRTYRNDSARKYAEFVDTTSGSMIIEEALNSLFTVSLFDYEEDDIAYQLQSNMFKLIIESMDNYNLNDYVNHSSSYFAKKLDEFTGHKNYASVMFRVIDSQYTDYHNEYIEIEQSEYYPLYEWISDIYYKNRLTSDLSYDEMRFITAGLIERLTFDVPEEYHIDVNYFYTYLDKYIEEHNLGSHLSR